MNKESWLISGGNGFIGHHLISLFEDRLRKDNAADDIPILYVIVRQHWATYLANVLDKSRALRAANRLKFLVADLSDLNTLAAVVPSDIDVVIHIAARGGDWGRLDDYILANQVGTQNLVTTVKSQCPNLRRFVHISTIDVYPHSVPPSQCFETVPAVSQSPYGYTITKSEAERIVIRESPGRECYCILRVGVVYGPHTYSFGYVEAGVAFSLFHSSAFF